MLSKANRLLRRQDFQSVYQHGYRANSPHLSLRALPVLSQPSLSSSALPTALPVPTRIGIVVSRKAAGKRAVVRNQVKRRLRAACRQLLPKIQPGWLLVISARSGCAECDYGKFLQELEQLLAKTGVLSIHHGYS
ncbi:ribonuclease P protein component [Trichothermofontia sp.]